MRKAFGCSALLLFTWAVPCSGQSGHQYNLPHIANGSFGNVTFRTTFILLNNSDASSLATLRLTDNDGNPLNVNIGGLGTGSQFTIGLNAGTTTIFQTDGRGSGAVGAATVSALSSIGVSAIFTVYDAMGNFLAESGVESSDSLSEFVLPIDSMGSQLTGLALFNPGADDASLTMTLFDTDGANVGVTTRLLKHGNHTAAFAGQLFPAAANFRGTLLVQSTSPIAALALRQYQDSSRISYTSLPVASRSSAISTLNLPHVVNGSYGELKFKTTFLVFNTSSSPANVVLSLTQNDGSPWILPLADKGATAADGSLSFTLANGAFIALQSDGSGAGASGAAAISSNVPVAASAILTAFDAQGAFQNETGLADAQVLTSMTLPVEVTGVSDTGVAFFNPATTPATLALKLLDYGGALVATKAQTIGSKGHMAIFVDQLFPVVRNFRGSLAISSTVAVAATALRQNSPHANFVTYTTLPSVSGVATGTPPVPPLLAKGEAGIDATGGATLNETLSPGYKLSGTVTGAGVLGSVYVMSRSGSYSGRVDSPSGRYAIVLPAGIYDLAALYVPPGIGSGASLLAAYTAPSPLLVSGDTTFDVVLPSLPLTQVSIHISGLSSLPPATGMQVLFTSSSVNNPVYGRLPLDSNGDGVGVLPRGIYEVGVSLLPIQLGPFQSDAVTFGSVGTLVVGDNPASGTYAIPPTAKLSGVVEFPGLQSIRPGLVNINAQSELLTSNATVDASGKYQMILAQDKSYAFSVTLPLMQATAIVGTIRYPSNPTAVLVGGDTTRDFSVPSLPAQVIISGQVTDTSGNGLPNININVYSTSLTGVPEMGFYGGGRTDVNGRYSIPVLSGRGYQIGFAPVIPTP